jgi:hypothetical protein
MKLDFIVLLMGALALAPGMAHLLEMFNKMHLSQESYGTVQYVYRGWAWLGIIQIGAVLVTLAFLFQMRGGKGPGAGKQAFRLVLAAWICQTLTLVVFFVFTFPANRSTQNWSVLPVDWEVLRARWEYSHAVNALLELIAYVLLLTAVLKMSRRRYSF